MNWEKLDLHIENLIPGVVIVAILSWGWTVDPKPISSHEAFLVAALIATSYMLGAVANVLARFLLDYVGRHTVRPHLMWWLIPDRRVRLGLQEFSFDAINRRFSEVITVGVLCSNNRIESEVAKRRQTSRLIRSALLPALLFVAALRARDSQWTVTKVAVAAIAIYVFLLLLYVYSEVVIFHEAYRGEQINKKSEKQAVRL